MTSPFFAEAERTLKPEHVDVEHTGYFLSVPSDKQGWRVYAFDTQPNRDRFVNKYRPHGARPCKDPWS